MRTKTNAQTPAVHVWIWGRHTETSQDTGLLSTYSYSAGHLIDILLIFALGRCIGRPTGATDAVASLTHEARCKSSRASFLFGGTVFCTGKGARCSDAVLASWPKPLPDAFPNRQPEGHLLSRSSPDFLCHPGHLRIPSGVGPPEPSRPVPGTCPFPDRSSSEGPSRPRLGFP